MTVRLSFKDGYWYVDAREGNGQQFKPDSRHTRIDDALSRIRALATNN